jgi:nucleoside-diphosphate-sugar epimerase
VHDESELDEALSTPRDATVAALARTPGDIVILGAGGKMGPTLARMARRACEHTRRVVAVSRFTSVAVAESLRDAGVDVIAGDLLDREFVSRLPDAPNVVFMAGQKFGTTHAPGRTWMMNVVLPAICAERYRTSRIVAFSTGNVYPLVPVGTGGARESGPLAPVGEYAQSCLGRERMFEHFAAEHGTRTVIVRLTYAIDLRYGVLADLAMKICAGMPISLTMGYVNVIWQRDANRIALELLQHASTPPLVVNVTGRETLRIKGLAEELGQLLGRAPVFEGTESDDALLSDTSRMLSLLPAPDMKIDAMMNLVADWVRGGRPMLGKATHFETRDGKF